MQSPEGPHAAESDLTTTWSLILIETQSVLGAEIARFGISVWVYKSTQSVTAFAMLVIASSVPGILVAPLVGSLVDRYSRKLTLMLASCIGLIGTLVVFGGAAMDHLSLVTIAAGAALASIGETFQWTALASILPLMAKSEQLPKFNGFIEAGRALSTFAGPILGGLLYGLIGLPGLLSVEIVTFAIAVLVLAYLTLPNHAPQAMQEKPNLLNDYLFGLRWLWREKTLLKFLGIAVFANFFISIGIVLMTPYGLSSLDESSFGLANGLFGGGMMAGGLLYGVVAPRAKNIQLVFASLLTVGLAFVLYGFARNLYTLASINFLFALMITLNNAATLTIWQRKIPEEYTGRVLSAVRMVAFSTLPVAYGVAGPLAEKVMPAIYGQSGDFVQQIKQFWGEGAAGQMGLLFSVMGACLILGFAGASLDRGVRGIDDT